MITDIVAQELVGILSKLPYARKTTDGREMRIRCPYCGDSIKHANSTHLYIKIYREEPDKEPFPYYCQRCQARGLVDKEFLDRVESPDISLGLKLIKINHHASKVNKKYKAVEKANLKIPEFYDNDNININKLNYINRRLGLKLEFKDLHHLKIVLNLYDLLDMNNITNLNCQEDKADIYDNNFIGFVSYDNNFLIQRNTSSTVMTDIRYNNYNIFNNHNNAKKFYVIPTTIDIMKPSVKIVLTEGCFDILGVYHHIYNGDNTTNTIYASINGVGYLQVINQLIKVTSILDYDLEIYSDSDQKLSLFKKLKNDLGHLKPNSFKVFYNKLSKDYGVTSNNIELIHHII